MVCLSQFYCQCMAAAGEVCAIYIYSLYCGCVNLEVVCHGINWMIMHKSAHD